MYKNITQILVTAFIIMTNCQAASLEKADANFNLGWKFQRLEQPDVKDSGFENPAWNDRTWESVALPHTANLEPLVVTNQWQGICWYRKTFSLPASAADQTIILEFDGAMSTAQVWINGQLAKEHQGGYLPIVIDATTFMKPGAINVVAVRLDNRDDPLTGPKPLAKLDFNMYGGLYREARMLVKNKVHISHPQLANKIAGGGIFITYPKVSTTGSLVNVKTDVVNQSNQPASVQVVQTVYYDGKSVAKEEADPVTIKAGGSFEFGSEIKMAEAKLWSPRAPNLYSLKTTVTVAGKMVDEASTRFGIREFVFKGHELFINGEKTYLRGVNRHQEYPFVGYALSDNAQYRDAKKIKDAGFDYVRLSHYPQAPAFMDACDELGLVTLAAIPGWQYYLDDDRFRDFCYRSATELIRRDRNHPSVLAWEVSLNETKMPVFFMQALHRIAHAEFPGVNTYTAGWMNEVYDIFLQARQHKIGHGYHEDLKKPYMVSEYGDWEYFSSNAGLNQDKLDKTRRVETSSRQLRAYGEKRLLLQARNLQEAYNDNLNTSAYSDAYWVMYDYNRGYYDDLEASGVMDIFRLPKFSYPFYQSQRDPAERIAVNIASWWTPASALDVKVFSNCDEVELRLNNRVIARQKPDTDKNSTNLKHPPFTFKLGAFEPGTLKAIGYLNGKAVGEHIVKTPGQPVKLQLWLDESGKAPQAGVNDALFAYIAAVDEYGTIVPTFTDVVTLKLNGDAVILNVGEIKAEAGIATALIRIGQQPGKIQLQAGSADVKSGELTFRTK